jgi:hypothetical protein
LVLVVQCHVHHNNVRFVLANNLVQVVDLVVLVDNVQDLQRVHNKVLLVDNVQDLQRAPVKVAAHVHKAAVQVADLLIVQVETLVVDLVVQVDLIVQGFQVAIAQVQVAAVILQVHLVKVDQRRVMPRRARKLCVMISKTCKRLHLAA